MKEELEKLQKKLLYKALHRGTKELDILFGNFVKNYIYNLSSQELIELTKLTDCNDHDLWHLFSKENTEEHIDLPSSLRKKITEYKQVVNGITI